MSSRRRIDKGSWTTLEQVSQLIKQFTNMRKMMKNNGLLGRIMDSGIMPPLGGMGMGGGRPHFGRGSNYTPPKKKRKKR